MALIPSLELRKPTWRGSTSSAEMNSNFEEILYDLNTIFAEATSLVVELNDMESRIRHEANALSSRMYAVSGLITSYERGVNASGYKMLHEDFFLTKNIAWPTDLTAENRCIVNTEFGTVTLPVNNSFSKVYTVKLSDNTVYQAPDLKAEVVAIDEDGVVKMEEKNTLNAFDNDEMTVWERKVKFNRDYVKSEVECRLRITLPSMSNPYVNKVYIKPYPEGTVDVTAFTYDTLTSQDNVLSTFPTDGENNIPSKMYSFNNIQPTVFNIDFRQQNSALEDDYKTFVYGAKEIGIEKVEYKSSGKIGVELSLPDYETGLFRYITSLDTDPDYDNSIYKISLYPTKANFNSDTPAWTSANTTISANNKLDISAYITSSVWILVEMTQTTGNTDSPLLDSITITYTTT